MPARHGLLLGLLAAERLLAQALLKLLQRDRSISGGIDGCLKTIGLLFTHIVRASGKEFGLGESFHPHPIHGRIHILRRFWLPCAGSPEEDCMHMTATPCCWTSAQAGLGTAHS